jgi:hypothetical protein
MRKSSRRGFVGFLALLFRPLEFKGQSTAASSADLPALGARAAVAPSRSTSRTYRADAAILFLGISIYRRAAVGGGRASFEESGEGASLRRTIFFAGGSDPKQAHGLRRLGWIEEVISGLVSAPSEAAYFGVLTSSPEESLEHARKSVAAPPSGSSIFSAVSGRHTAGHSRSAVTHFDYADSAIWSDRGLIEHAQATFNAKVDWRDSSWPTSPNQAPPTFLLQLATLLKQRARRAEGRYVYNEQEYLLQLETAQTSREREHLLPFRGMVRNLLTAHEVTFRLWLDETTDSIIPVRIEFQPRSFLRLTFEALPG